MSTGPAPPDAYGEAFAEVYDRWYDGVTDAEATARFVAERAAGGPVIELGVGTGRLARPLTERGLTVIGVDASAAMLSRCDRGRHAERLILVQADMARLPLEAVAPCALVAFNTLFNVPSAAGQRAVFRSVARALRPGGLVIVEALDLGLGDGATRPVPIVSVRDHLPDGVRVVATVVDPRRQWIRGQHTDVTDEGVTVRPWLIRWSTPAQIDGYAADAGFEVAERWADWSGAAYQAGGGQHVSVYRLTTAASPT